LEEKEKIRKTLFHALRPQKKAIEGKLVGGKGTFVELFTDEEYSRKLGKLPEKKLWEKTLFRLYKGT